MRAARARNFNGVMRPEVFQLLEDFKKAQLMIKNGGDRFKEDPEYVKKFLALSDSINKRTNALPANERQWLETENLKWMNENIGNIFK